jgi:hypothetical protein
LVVIVEVAEEAVRQPVEVGTATARRRVEEGRCDTEEGEWMRYLAQECEGINLESLSSAVVVR